ncbi:MAG: glycosyltransferase [Candidatus Binatia bacterium]
MRVALVHDALVNRGGAERVAAVFCEAFSGAPLYTSVYLPERTYPAFRDVDVRPSPLLSWIRTERAAKLSLPLLLYAMRRHDLGDVDLVLSSSTFAGKFVRTRDGATHVSYCYTPFRLAWDSSAYTSSHHAPNRAMLALAGRILRPIDRRAATGVDTWLTMTEETRRRVHTAYGVDAEIIPPPVDCSRYRASSQRQDRYLVVSRLEPYKRVDVVVEAFNQLGRALVVVGDGTMAGRLRAQARTNITFLSGVSDEDLRELYSTSRAVVFPQVEDYGLVPLESIASGTPVIAYAAGGVLGTMIPAADPDQAPLSTALFFRQQRPEDVCSAVQAFEGYDFDPVFLRTHALRFDKPQFIAHVRQAVERAVSARRAR